MGVSARMLMVGGRKRQCYKTLCSRQPVGIHVRPVNVALPCPTLPTESELMTIHPSFAWRPVDYFLDTPRDWDRIARRRYRPSATIVARSQYL